MSDQPITLPDEDRLDRTSFVGRLRDTLIDSNTGKSRHVVIGVTGPWGAGKSSILNLLRRQIDEKFPHAVTFHFDPWLLAGRDDLVLRFMNDLRSEVGAVSVSERLKGFGRALTKYAAHLAPLADIAAPGGGTAVSRFLGLFKKSKLSMERIRQSVIGELEKIDVPIVVLVDEIDRLDDDEIKTVCQLVRSVMDFPNISYVLAYDERRVIQALGSVGSPRMVPANAEQRGAHFLEKIVQEAAVTLSRVARATWPCD